jgi:hypothetical protein
MFPIKTAESNFSYLGPSPEIADLPCRREGTDTFSIWALSDEERQLIAGGANIRLGLYGAHPMPPVSLEICAKDGTSSRVPQPCIICGSEVDHACHGPGPECHAFRTHLNGRRIDELIGDVQRADV